MQKKIAGLIMAGVATTALGLGATAAAFAETTVAPTPESSATPARSGTPGQADRGPGRHGRMTTELASQLADKLGLDETRVTEALAAVRSDLRDSGGPAGRQDRPSDPTAREGELTAKLAGELGVDEAKVTEALAEIRAAHRAEHSEVSRATLDQAVTDGKLTRAEADAVLKAAELGVIGGGGRHR